MKWMMKKYFYIGVAIVIFSLSSILWATINSKRNIEKQWKDAMENVKSYSDEYTNSENKNRAFKLTIEQLKTYNDSIFQELNKTRKDLKVKDSKLQSLQYVSSDFTRIDTIHVADTIFRDPQVNVDTLLSDGWYSVRVGLRYPSMVSIEPRFKSVKHIVVSSRKETVNPPKKFFLFRWFQKKHYVLNIDVIEKNPYVQNQTNRYVEIIR